jgi:hypothetical protein
VRLRAALAGAARAGVVVLAPGLTAGLAGCAGRVRAAAPPAPPAHAGVLAAAGVPGVLTGVRLGAPYGEVRAARPASLRAFGTGRFEEVADWTVSYHFADPPTAPGTPIEEVIRREPAPEQPMRRLEFSRPVPADSAEALWAVAVVRAQAAAGTAARCTRFAVPGWGPADRIAARGAAAYLPLPGPTEAPRTRVAILYSVGTAEEAAARGAAAGPRPARLSVIAEPPPDVDLSAFFETDTVPCPTGAGSAHTPERARANHPDA